MGFVKRLGADWLQFSDMLQFEPMRKRGQFITIEGIEGCGKSTQVNRLSDHLRQRGISVITSKEPGGTGIGVQIRRILLDARHAHMHPWCETFLYFADRVQHLTEKVQPALDQGTWVISDRFQDSTLAYQGGGRGLPAEKWVSLFEQISGHTRPDLTLILDLAPEIGLRRARHRNRDRGTDQDEGRFEAEELAFHHRVRTYFLDLAQRENRRFVVVDGSQDEDTVAASVVAALESRFFHV